MSNKIFRSYTIRSSVEDPDPEDGSGSVGSVCFWASWIRIRIRNLFVQIRILPSKSEKMKKNLDFCDFFMTFYLRRMMLIYLQNERSMKTLREIIFFICFLRSLTKRAGSGSGACSASGSVSHKYGSEDPDPHPDP